MYTVFMMFKHVNKIVLVFLCFSAVSVTTTKAPAQSCVPEPYITYDRGDTFKLSCLYWTLEDSKNKLAHPTRFHTVTLNSCKPVKSYADSLRKINVFVKTILILTNLNDLPETAFICLPHTVKKVVLSAKEHVKSSKNRDFLKHLRVSSLELNRVWTETPPPGLEELKVVNTGLKANLPYQIDVINYTIQEHDIGSLHVPAPRLLRLSVTGPVRRLPEAPILTYLEIYQIGFKVPDHLLSSTPQLRSFTFEQGNFTTLPENLFRKTPKLEVVSLSDNKLTFLSSKLFYGLPNLVTLRLNNNGLVARDINTAVAPLTSLKILEIRNNPLGKLCPNEPYKSKLSNMHQLEVLDLAMTNTPRVCSDWLHNMPKLIHLRLDNNAITSLSCRDLHAKRDQTLLTPYVNLKENPLDRVVCTREDFVRTAREPEPEQEVSLIPEVQLKCDCDAYWLSRVLCARSVAMRLHARYGDDTCNLDQLGCDIDEVDMEIRGVKCPENLLHYNYGRELSRPYELSCKKVPLNSPHHPHLPKPVRFNTVNLDGCVPPPGKSYVEALFIILDVILGYKLVLNNLPSSSHLSPATFACVPPTLGHLVLIASDGVLVPKLGTLGRLQQVHTLELTRVRPYDLPTQLETLKLDHTGYEKIPDEACNVVNLEINEEIITSISLSAPRLKNLSLITPALKTLSISNAVAEDLPQRFAKKCNALERVELTRLRGRRLPCALLPGATGLKTFLAERNDFTSLPPDLFAYSPRLEKIDLSYNQLVYLPSEVFSGLTALRTLCLQHNRLRAHALMGAAGLPTLVSLRAQRNPLGDLCDTGGAKSILSSLHDLEILDLSQTGATRLCPDWLGMLRLRTLDLGRNNISSLFYADLRVRRLPSNSTPTIDLRDNPIVQANCSQEDLELASKGPVPIQKVNLQIDSKLKCDCQTYILFMIFQERSLAVNYQPVFEKKCTEVFLKCFTKMK